MRFSDNPIRFFLMIYSSEDVEREDVVFVRPTQERALQSY